MSKILLVDFDLEPRPDFQNLLPEIKVPRSYTKQESIDKYILEATAKAATTAATNPYAGHAVMMAFKTLDATSPEAGMTDNIQTIADFLGSLEQGTVLVGFGVREKLRVLIATIARANLAGGGGQGSCLCYPRITQFLHSTEGSVRSCAVDPVSWILGGLTAADSVDPVAFAKGIYGAKPVCRTAEDRLLLCEKVVTDFGLSEVL